MSTWQQPDARIPAAWAARNCRQLGDGRRGAGASRPPARIRRIVPAPIRLPEAEELTLYPAVPPPRVLPGQPPDQRADLLRDRRPSGGVRAGPRVLDQAPVPGEQGAGCHDPVPQVPGQSRASAAIAARSAQSCFGPAAWRRRTATSCRSTKISTSFDASLRISSTSQANRWDTARQTSRMSTNVEGRSPGQMVCTSSGTAQTWARIRVPPRTP